ncbi:MAG: hypothetical protein RJB39_771 [Candidatus Parcubacteria bacterium]|jgi:DNA helicase-2/ATP-dependent DNA helicase PcrA
MDTSYLDSLNKAQQKAVLKTEGPLLIIAGAGAGKTKTITTRILHLTLNGVAPENILAITFTNKAAKEMKERVFQALNTHREGGQVFSYQQPFVSTFHSLGVHLLKKFGHKYGLSKHVTILDRDDSKKKVKEILIEKGHDPKKIEPSKILNIISKQKGNNISLAEFTTKTRTTKNGYGEEVAAIVWADYDRDLRKEKAVDFDDLLMLPVRLLKEFPDVREYCNSLWQYIHVDEYQDTNPIQYELCKLLAGDKKNIAVVGDADQTIYTWRGANISHILEFEHDFPGTEVVLLEQNYRSTGNIIEAANAIIEKNICRKKKNLFTDKEGGEQITVYTGLDETDESHYVAREIKGCIQNGSSPKDIAVLYRANFQSRALEEACLFYGVPYQVLGTKFFERKEIKDMVSYLRAAINRNSLTDIKRTINTPTRGIGNVTVIKVVTEKTHELPATTQQKVYDYFRLLDTIKTKSEAEKLSDVFKYILQASGFEKIFKDGNEDDHEKLENIKELVSLTAKYDLLSPEEGVALFLEEAGLMSDQDELDAKDQENKVRLMTVHASKGLEYDTVFITGLEENLFPCERMGESENQTPEEEEEERRLFYVAVTRAKKKLYLTHVMMRTIFGARQFRTESEFLNDIPANLQDSIDNTNAFASGKTTYAPGERRKGGLLDLSEIDF